MTAQQPERPTSFVADIPPEPTGLRSFRDRDGDFWELDASHLRDGRLTRWRCARAKVPMGIGRGVNGDWLWIVTQLGPLRPVEWVEDVPVTDAPPASGPYGAVRADG